MLGIEEIPAHIIEYTEDELKKQKDVKDLIESNLKQRVPGNSNPVKLGRCFAFLEEYYGAKHGGNRKSSGNDYHLKSQVDIANEVGLSPETIRAYKRLASAIPEIQELVETGKVSPTTALSIIRQLPEDEQRKLSEQISGSQDRATSTKVQELIDQLAEKDKRISELENQKPKIKEVEVMPKDYKQLKKDLNDAKRQASAYKQDYQREQKRFNEKASENLKLRDEVEELKRQTVREQNNVDLSGSAITFAMECRIFLQNMGGYTFVAEHLMELNDRDREGYVVAAKAMRDWASILLDTIERNSNGLYGSYTDE